MSVLYINFFYASRRRHTSCAFVTGVQTCALPISVDGSVIHERYVEHYPPDTTAAIFWLKNRRKEQWRDKHEHEHTGGLTVTMGALDAIGRASCRERVWQYV